MKRSIITLLLVVSLAGMATVISGCNTMSGLGQDIEQAGDSIHKAAENRKEK
ncbi:MAG: entericidin A/B family lipoprotein [Desulfopila sp.]